MEVISMQEIKKAYAILCGAASDALDALPELPENVRGRWILENALSKAEQLICDDDSVSCQGHTCPQDAPARLSRRYRP